VTVEIYAWRDTERDDFRALIYENDRPMTATRAGSIDELQANLTAIQAGNGISDADVTTYECGEMAAPSFYAVRAKGTLVRNRRAAN
jgi:hypothetical protein